MIYREALSFIYSLTNYEARDAVRARPSDFSLERMEAFLTQLGDPHLQFKSVHIAGSKGKGSTAAMTASILHASGLKVGLYTQPHLHTFRERMRVAGPQKALFGPEAMIGQGKVADFGLWLKAHLAEFPGLTAFEAMTGLCFLHFAEEGVDIAVVEVGLGGRLDSTNVIRPLVAVITSLSYEHTQVLGNTLAQIAWEKAGIVKEGTPVVSAPQQPEALEVIEEVARERRAHLTLIGRDWTWRAPETNHGGQSFQLASGAFPAPQGELWMPLLGAHSLENAALAVATAALLKGKGLPVEEESIREGLKKTIWPGRLEVLGERPFVVLDGAHNLDSVQRMRTALAENFAYRRLILIFGAMADKAIDDMLRELSPHTHILIATRSQSPRAAPPAELVKRAEAYNVQARATESTQEALERALALAGPEDLVCATGSLYLVAEIREAWFRRQRKPIPGIDEAD